MEKYDINKLAMLSKLSFDEDELLSMADDMKNIIELMDDIKKTEKSMTADELSKLSVKCGFFSVSKVL